MNAGFQGRFVTVLNNFSTDHNSYDYICHIKQPQYTLKTNNHCQVHHLFLIFT